MRRHEHEGRDQGMANTSENATRTPAKRRAIRSSAKQGSIARMLTASTRVYPRCCDHFTRNGLVARNKPLASATQRSNSMRASGTEQTASRHRCEHGRRTRSSDVPARSSTQ